MAVPGIPNSFLAQQANAKVLLTWDLMAGALSYYVSRSTDGVTYAQIATPSVNSYTDTAVTIGTQYFYKVQSHNADGESAFTAPQSVVPTRQGQMSLGQLRLASQQRADRVNSNFVTKAEWNSYINQSAFELYDILVTTFEDYYVKEPFVFQTDGSTQQYDLSVLIPDFYKLMGVDCGLNLENNAWVTLKKFDFVARNRYVYPQISATYLGVFNLQYRLIGSTKLMFIPVPNTAQYIRIWYVPRMVELLADNDILDGLSGWTEYVIVDAAIKALQKEESDVSVLMAQKQALLDRIQSTAANRDVGQPDTVSNTRSRSEAWGNYGPDGDGSFGGF